MFVIFPFLISVGVKILRTPTLKKVVVPPVFKLKYVSLPSAVTVSGIQSGYYFTVFDSNTGSGLTSYDNPIGITTVGIGTSFLDNIYKVHSAKTIQGPALGIGATALRRVTVSVSSTEGIGIGSGSFGKFSWGRLHDFVKKDTKAFTAITNDGITGIKTGPVIIRTSDLKESYS